VDGRFTGDSTAAPTRADIDVDLDAPFVTPELVVPGEGVELGGAGFEAVVTVRVGQVQAVSPGRLAVEVSQVVDATGRRRSVAAGETDAAGRASLMVPAARFAQPGAVRLVPRVDLGGGRIVEGVGRDLLVRGRTALSLLRDAAAEGEGDGAALHGALVLTSGAPVAGAAVRLLRAERTVAAARTDARGHYVISVGADALGEAGVVVRAVFEPTEPWFVGAESLPLALTEPPPPPIRWTWTAAPLLLAALASVVIALRRRPAAPADAPPPPRGQDHVVRVAVVRGAHVHVVLRAVDRSTGAALAEARVRVGDGASRRCDDGDLALPVGREASVIVEAEGFAPRAVTLDLSRPGELRVQVALRGWREELFARMRPWIDAARPSGALPTPREIDARGADLAALVAHVERGCYGPGAPGPAEVQAADALSEEARRGANARPGSALTR
jgi:hypothetical protein